MTRFGKSGHHRDWYLRLTSKEDRTKPEVESPDEEWVSRPWTGIDGEVAWQTPDGKLHRIGAPAALRHDGTEEWWERGERHRVGGPATARRRSLAGQRCSARRAPPFRAVGARSGAVLVFDVAADGFEGCSAY